jgi:hypothetical protein
METRVVISLGYGGEKACLGHRGEDVVGGGLGWFGVVFSKEEAPGVNEYFQELSSAIDAMRFEDVARRKSSWCRGYSGLTGLEVTGASR